MSDLAGFLLARIAEEEAANSPGPEPESWCDRADGLHFDHRRVLAECEAKRRIVEWATGGSSFAYPPVLHLLALPYVDHPDYRQEWRQ